MEWIDLEMSSEGGIIWHVNLVIVSPATTDDCIQTDKRELENNMTSRK